MAAVTAAANRTRVTVTPYCGEKSPGAPSELPIPVHDRVRWCSLVPGRHGRIGVVLCRSAAALHPQRPHLAIEIRPLDAERLGRFADPAAVLFEHGGDVLALEARARLLQRAAVRDHRGRGVET